MKIKIRTKKAVKAKINPGTSFHTPTIVHFSDVSRKISTSPIILESGAGVKIRVINKN